MSASAKPRQSIFKSENLNWNPGFRILLRLQRFLTLDSYRLSKLIAPSLQLLAMVNRLTKLACQLLFTRAVYNQLVVDCNAHNVISLRRALQLCGKAMAGTVILPHSLLSPLNS